ncbi:SURF1 family protein [Rhodobacteraceae bacterium THAF1]|uniref:SURF1 family protein n=1 Tax=Palleronia sp. THAF1 TaxID=2587842 RepID=UPI000F3F70FA|nr:SURF1 family protein [Palleronia sp. THAF1]QFU07425.1 SURF1 family protein [Palleronia sp. THAF1]VDC20663.1 SURF1 family protein [Rhodobacteraceae bacterium THAF1]
MRWIGLAVLGLGGVALLCMLGFWQVDRLGQKTALLNEVETGIVGDPVALPEAPMPENDRYLPVRLEGRTTGDELHILTSTAETGAGYRVVAPFETGQRRVMVDLGFIPAQRKDIRPAQRLEIIGNLDWPRETDGFTPEPQRADNIWFARDVPLMADALGTEPLLVVAREVSPALDDTILRPVSTAGIPNNHRQYAITWFSIALLWAGMTVFLGWRIAKGGEERS